MLEYAAACYGFDRAACRFLAHGREDAKQLYTFSSRGKPYVLRFVKGPPGELSRTRAEMDWLSYLAGGGADVPLPLRTKNGELAVSMEEGGETCTIAAFSKAEGCYWDKNDPALWNKGVFYGWGKAVGGIHRLTKAYRPANDADRRGGFDIRSMIGEGIRAFPSVAEIAEGLFREMARLPKDAGAYGLIHNDLHPGNLTIDGGRVHLFDFDGCAYAWYAFDIAGALYMALWLGRSNDAGMDFANDIIECFLKGYLSANRLSDFWLSWVLPFMLCYKIALFSYGCDSETPDHPLSGGDRRLQMRNIENNILFTGCRLAPSLFRNAHD